MTVVEVQLVPVLAGAASDSLLIDRLAPGEWEAIRSLGFAADRDRAVTARAAARLALGRRLGVQPRKVALLAPEITGGRPLVCGSDLAISWSHSGDWVVVALAAGRPVGIDVELLPARPPTRALRQIGVRSMKEFVAREAVGKLTGMGLSTCCPADVRVRAFDAPAGYLGAVAASGEDWSLELHDLGACEPRSAASAVAVGIWDLTPTVACRTAYGAARAVATSCDG